MLINRELENKIEFDKIREKLKNLTNSNLGISKVDEIKFNTNEEIISTQLSETEEFKQIIVNEALTLDTIYDLRANIAETNATNSYFTTKKIYELSKTLETQQAILSFFKSPEKREKYPLLSSKSSKINPLKNISDKINRLLTKTGEIKNNASPNLKHIRAEITTKQSQISGIVRRAFTEAKKNGLIDEEATITIRNGLLLIPIDTMYKNKIRGIVQDQSTTGKTVYVEPIKSIELNNQIKNLIFEEKREIIKILISFTNDLKPYFYDITNSLNFLGDIDLVQAKAKLATQMDSARPLLTNTANINIKQAKHPLLLLAYKKTRKKIVPLDLELTNTTQIILISGPNAGGKSIAIKTVALLQYMTQCGLLIPANPTSELGIFDKIFVDIGDDQSLDNDLSTYSSHLIKMKKILENATKKTLVVIDEFGTGTDPALGGAIAEAILEELLKKNTRAIINTHYSNLKHFASEKQNITNAAMLFNKQLLKPTYLLETGRPGSSFAFEIAQKIGLDNKIIQKAKNKAGKNTVNFDKIITNIENQARKIQKEKYELNKTKTELKKTLEIYKNEKEKIIAEKKKIITQTNNQLNQILKNANKNIEKTIKEIRTNQTNKENLKKIRTEFVQNKNIIVKNIENIKKTVENEEKELKKYERKKPEIKLNNQIKKGDIIRVKKSGLKGKIENIKNQNVTIIAGNFRTSAKLNEIEKIAEHKNTKNINVDIKIDKTNTENTFFGLDIRGKKATEAVERVAKFIDNAIINQTQKTKILHGTGNGILRNTIRQYLKNIPQIEWFGDEDIRMGGQGITKITFKK